MKMKKSRWFGVILLLVVTASLLGAGCAKAPSTPTTPTPVTPTPVTPSPAAPEVIHWVGQTSYQPGPPWGHFNITAVGGFPRYWADWIKDATDGRLIVDLAPPGSIVGLMETFDAVSKGAIQFAGMHCPCFYTGIMPEGEVTMLPYAWESQEEDWDAMYNMGLYEELQPIYARHNLFFIECSCNDVWSFGAAFPLDGPDAIKGKKIRAAGMVAEVIELLGGSPVTVPWPEAYMALKLGTIDATTGTISALEDLKMKEVWKNFVVSPQFGPIGCEFLINLDAWNSLPEDIKELIEERSRYVLLGYGCDYAMQRKYWTAEAEREYDFRAVTWSKEDTKFIKELAIGTVWESFAAKSPDCARLCEIVRDQMRALGRIE